MTITDTIDTVMSTDVRDGALRQAQSQGYRHITVMQVPQVGHRRYEVDPPVTR